MEFSIYRYDPDKDQKPYYQSFKFERKEVTGQMVLDALDFLQSAYSIVKRTLRSYRRLNARLIITLAVTLSQGVLCKSFVKQCFS